MAKKFKIKKGDRVVVTTGKDKGKSGEVLRVLRDKDRVLVQGVNMIKRHTRPGPANPGGIIEREATLHISNVALIDPQSQEATRVGYKVLDDGRKLKVHCPNPGSMRGTQAPGSAVRCSTHDDPRRKLRHTLEMIRVGRIWVGLRASMVLLVARCPSAAPLHSIRQKRASNRWP